MAKPSKKRTADPKSKPSLTTGVKRITRGKAKKSAATSKREEARVSAPPLPRRAIFVDVENTSSEVDLMRVIDSLQINRTAQATQLTAIGNWRSVGQRMARQLAGLGAQLVHSAPATGVRDWSDLWIAVAAGCWLGTAAAGDRLEIVSDDRAFDAVGDAAAVRGVWFRRVPCRTVTVTAARATPEHVAVKQHRPRRRGRRRTATGVARQTPGPSATEAAQATATAARRLSETAPEEPAHSASHEQIKASLVRLTGNNPERWVNLDVLTNALKAEGFTRPPGSPRLVTRLRKFKDLEISVDGMVRLGESSSKPEITAAPPPAATTRRSPRRQGVQRKRSRRTSPEKTGAGAPDLAAG